PHTPPGTRTPGGWAGLRTTPAAANRTGRRQPQHVTRGTDHEHIHARARRPVRRPRHPRRPARHVRHQRSARTPAPDQLEPAVSAGSGSRTAGAEPVGRLAPPHLRTSRIGHPALLAPPPRTDLGTVRAAPALAVRLRPRTKR